MTAVSHYWDEPTVKHYYGSLAEMLALTKAALATGTRFFCSDTAQEYVYAASKDWILWSKHTVS